MNLRRTFIHGYLHLPYGFHKISRTGPFGRNRAEFIQGPIQSLGNPLKAALIKHQVKQFHGSSCSVASVVSVVNAIRDLQCDAPVPITQMEILEKVRTAHWKERMSPKGHNGRRGLPLPVLGEVVKSSLDVYGIAYAAVEIVRLPKNSDAVLKARDLLRRRLIDFEKKGDGLIIAHFDQGAYLPALNIPHISPVGGFDVETGRVLILDVDLSQELPYTIAFDTFYRGISGNYPFVMRPFGFDRGGYVYIKLPEPGRSDSGHRR